MEFAVSALLLLLLLLPGFILQLSYTKGLWRWNSPIVTRPITEIIPSSIVAAIILHLLWAPIASLFAPVNLNVLMMFLLGNFGHEEEHLMDALNLFSEHPFKVCFYFLSLYAFAAAVGYFAHVFVRSYHIDHEVRSLRFNNEWFYWLSGEITNFCDTDDVEGKLEGVYLSAVVQHGQTDYLYTGFVVDWFFDKDGALDRVILDKAMRRKLENDKTTETDDQEYYSIKGNYLILRYSQLCTINLQYLLVVVPDAPKQPITMPVRFIRWTKKVLKRDGPKSVLPTPQD
jgi:hypothetical protein